MKAWLNCACWFGASLVAVGIFCLPASIHQALWTDELFSLVVARERPSIFVKLLWGVHPPYYDQPPLYFLLLHPFTWAGNSALALRLPTLCFSVLALTVACVWARRAGLGVLFTLAMLLLLATQPTIRFQSTNIRMYSLFLFQNVILAFAAFRIVEKERRSWADIAMGALAVGAMFYTSFHATVVAAGLAMAGVLLFLIPRRFATGGLLRARSAGISMFVVGLLGITLGSVWLPAILRKRQIFNSHEFQFPVSLATQVLQVGAAMFGGVWPTLVLLLGLIFFVIWGRGRVMMGILFLGLAVAPSALAILLTPPEHFLSDRYFIQVPVWTFLIAGLGWQALGSRFVRLGRVPQMVVLLVFLSPAWSFDARMRATLFKPMPDWHAAAKILETNAFPGEGILTGGFMSGDAIEFVLPNPDKFTFHHKVYDLAPFHRMAVRDNVMWHINAGALPDPFVKIIKTEFPYSVSFEGRNLALIEVHAKKPFVLPWGGEAKYDPPIGK